MAGATNSMWVLMILSGWVHVGQLDGLPDLKLQALGTGPSDRKLMARVPRVLWVLIVELGGQAGVLDGPSLRLV